MLMGIFDGFGKDNQMSKKDFIALADALRLTEPTYSDSILKESQTDVMIRHAQWVRDIRTIADVCAATNPQFKRDRWMDYINGECGPNGGKPKGGK